VIRVAVCILLLFAVAGYPQRPSAHLSGEVTAGQIFQKDFGPDLVFRLRPTGTGWDIGIFPKAKCPDDNWAMVVNAPYRGYNALYLDASYGVSAKQAIAMSPRQFSFVLTCEAYKQELLRLNKILWPYTYPKEEVDEALAKLGSSPHATATLTIVAARTGVSEPGHIDWLKFTLDIKTPK
jgi:hypothetical protein